MAKMQKMLPVVAALAVLVFLMGKTFDCGGERESRLPVGETDDGYEVWSGGGQDPRSDPRPGVGSIPDGGSGAVEPDVRRPTPGTSVIKGSVREAEGGAGVKGAQVMAWSGRFRKTTYTEESGRYRIEGMPAGSARVRVRTRAHEDPPLLRVDLETGGEAIVDFEVYLGASIRGVVTDEETGAVIEGARIGVQASDRKSVVSGPDGSYRLQGFGPGVALLKAEADDYPRVRLTVSIPSREDEVVRDIALARGAVVRGIVVDSREMPVEAASVGLRRSGGTRVRTGPDGRFTLRAVPTGRIVWISADAEGYAPGQTGQLQFRPGEEIDEVRIVLLKGGTVRGRVLLSGGGPAAGAAVRIIPLKPARLWRLPNARTDVGGSFELEGVAPGDHRLTATLSGTISATKEVRGVTESGVVENVEVRLGAAESIKGTVLDHSGRPLPGVMVLAQPAVPGRGVRWGNARTNAEGRFVIGGLLPGAYRIHARAPRGGLRSETVEANAGATGLTLILPAPGAVEGRVVLASGEPATSCSLRLVPSPPGTTGGRVFTRVNDAKGEFRITGVAPGAYDISASGPDGYSDPLPPVVVSEGGCASGIVLTLSAGGAVRGKVLGADGIPVAGATVSLVSDGPREGMRAASSRGRSDADGSYAAPNLKPGTYRASATKDGRHTVPEAVVVTSGGDVFADLRFPPLGSLRIKVVDAAGRPLEGALVQVRDAGGNRVAIRPPAIPPGTPPPERAAAKRAARERARKTGPEGTCFREEVPSGTVEVIVLAPGFEDARATANVPPRGTAEVRVALRPGESSMGRRINREGGPLEPR